MKSDILHYKPGRFEYLMKDPYVIELWSFLSDEEQIGKMLRATEKELPAIEYFLDELEERFDEYLKSDKYRDDDAIVLVNNMIKQIMEHHGYVHAACGVCSSAKYIINSGVYIRL